MTAFVSIAGLEIDPVLYAFLVDEALPGTGVSADTFFSGLAKSLSELGPRNAALLARRDELQRLLDTWHKAHRGDTFDMKAYEAFLHEIGYIVPEGGPFSITTDNVDPEIASIAGPQLVVPLSNARYAVNAVNARWRSLYDALYGSDVIAETDGAEKTTGYNPVRGAKVVAYAASVLDIIAPLNTGSHADVYAYTLAESAGRKALIATLSDATVTGLRDPDAFVGYNGDRELSSILLRHHGLHARIIIDKNAPVGASHPAGVNDVLLEAAVTTIADAEDSVAAVDAADKTLIYRNWLGLMRGDLQAEFTKSGAEHTRVPAQDIAYTDPNGTAQTLPGRSLLLVRNVGLHMMTDAVRQNNKPVFEGIVDAFVTSLACLHDLKELGVARNTRTGSMYIVKPKQHGPDEVAFTVDLFSHVESVLGLPDKTIKIGVMDEERRTTINLKECIRAAQDRLIFINTGFLDRTGDEIHSIMEAGPVVRKADMKSAAWMLGYEDWNVDIGLGCGLSGRAQIGKGMWAKPDSMAEMVDTKIAHPQSGANCAWAPSPTAAVLHAIHYHQVDVFARQAELTGTPRATRETLLRLAVLSDLPDAAARTEELRSNIQSILGYVVRWVEHGIGCSKVPDLDDVGLMEDRATLRIASQLLANWLHHDLVSHEEVEDVLKEMAVIVDRQNENDPTYVPMTSDFAKNQAFQAARALIFEGRAQPNGYTEFVLHAFRRDWKAGALAS
ncbi:malate synthase G [Desulfovibrio inopinatus]|uniref:malate synthase G n=1 Tax=Desulfovibrio inopinatus TaxID=102109 RepID=UPI0003FA8670|nr:malate synthase G [Desulfovibrio inopinatus]